MGDQTPTDPETAIDVRQARMDDREAVVAFTQDTWAERDGSDYIPRVFEEWVETDGPRQRTLVADPEGTDDVAGIVQCVLISEHEAWGQGIRVNPDYRGQGIATRMTHEAFDWARGQGATVVRNMVFSWNEAGLGQSRATGYRPRTEFRWVHPDPDPEGVAPRERANEPLDVVTDPDAAWSFWTASDACDHLGGLGLTTEESWAVAEITRDLLRERANENALLAVVGDSGTRGMTYRTRTYEREDDDGVEQTYAEYGVGAWADLPAARELLSAIGRDAHDLGAADTRVLVPETPRVVSDAAYLRVDVADEPDFVFEADLTADYRGGW